MRTRIGTTMMAAALLFPAAGRADWRLEDIPEGTRVRVTSRSLGLEREKGSVRVAGYRGLVVDFDSCYRTPVPLPEVDRLEVLRHRGRATLYGAAAGFGLGALIGVYASATADVFAPGEFSHGAYAEDSWGGMVVGAGIGAVVGAIIGSAIVYETWHPLIWYEDDPDWGRGPGIGFRSRFPVDE